VTREVKKRVPDVVDENKDWIIRRWLERVTAHPELILVKLTESERKDHVPDLLDEALAYACGHRVEAQARQKAAERHGTLRYHEGYSVPMLILEAQLLQDAIAECIGKNLAGIDLTNLIADITTISDTITNELRESARAYISQEDWRSSQSNSA
jgi:hypothetical protein